MCTDTILLFNSFQMASKVTNTQSNSMFYLKMGNV